MDRIRDLILIIAFFALVGRADAQWSSQNSGVNNNLKDVHFRTSSNIGFAVGANGLILKTTNSGTNWSSLNSGVVNNLNAVHFTDANTGLVLGDAGLILRTTNAGTNWSTITHSVNDNINNIKFFNSTVATFVANNGRLARTTNAGLTWDVRATNVDNNLLDASYADQLNVFAVGSQGRIIKSTNNGTNWTVLTSPTTENLNSVHFTNSNVGIAVGNAGVIIRTTNGGSSWSSITSGTTQNLSKIYYPSDVNRALIVGANGTILYSGDGGLNWTAQSSPSNQTLNSVNFVSQNTGYIVGNTGTILSTSNLGGTLPLISLTRPTGVESWIAGNVENITWTSSNISQIKIEYSTNAGSNWNEIAVVNANLGTYAWSIPNNISSNQMLVRLSDNGGSNTVALPNSQFTIADYALQITQPVSSTIWPTNASRQITWNSQNISNLRIEYSTNSGTSWTTIANSVAASTGSFNWNVLGTPTTTARIRLSDANDANKVVSSPDFTIQGPSVRVTSPNGGESLTSGTTSNITWESFNVNNVRIEFTTNNGSTWQTIISSIVATANTFAWTVPDINTNNARIRIVDVANSNVSDISDNVFTLVGLPFFVTSPNGGEVLRAGQNFNITWSVQNVANINIEFSSNNGNTWQLVASNVAANNPFFTWTVPDVGSTSCLIRISDPNLSTKNDVSNATFTISKLNMIAPTMGESIYAGSNYNIAWSAFAVDLVNITYEGTTTFTIASHVSGSQPFFNWSVPNVSDNNVNIRITSTNNADYFDLRTVNIVTPSITVTSPNGGEYRQIGRTYPITWVQANVKRVNIQYSINGITWTNIASNVDATLGTYNWTIPGPPNSSSLVRVIDADNPNVSDISNATFIITNESVRLLSPNGRERYVPGNPTTIRWIAQTASFVNLDLSLDGGKSWTSIANNLIASSGQYLWTIPGVASDSVLIKVSDAQKLGIEDTSDELFRIIGVQLLSPNGFNQFVSGQIVNITWRASESKNVRIQFSPDAGVTWQNLSNSYPSSLGFFSWTVPYAPTTSGRLRIIDLDNTLIRDSTANLFSIRGIRLTSPNQGEQWLMTLNKEIKWLSSQVNNIRLEYTVNNTNWITIDAFVSAASGVYNWNVPENPSPNARIRVIDLDNPQNADTSASFVIRGSGAEIFYPNGGETFNAGDSINIEWVSKNVFLHRLEFSSNSGISWSIVSDSLPSNTRSFKWRLPSISTVNAHFRISDVENPNISYFNQQAFRITSGSFDVPLDWDAVTQTGENAIIIIPSNIVPRVNGANIVTGDAIGVFYTRNGALISGGYSTYTTGQATALVAWGDNSLTTIKDGFDNGEAYTFKIWKAGEGREYSVTPTYSGGSGTYRQDTISIISSLASAINLDIPLRANFVNLVSSNLEPPNRSFTALLAPISSSFEYLKTGEGLLYYPKQGIDQINRWDITLGYQILVNRNDTLRFTGSPISQNAYSFSFLANRWYLVPYLLQSSFPITSAIGSSWRVVMVKDGEGKVYYPQYNINQIGNMTPGQGYKVLSLGGNNIRYTALTSSAPQSNNPISAMNIDTQFDKLEYFINSSFATGSSAVYVIEAEYLKYRDEIAAITENGVVAGVSKVNEDGRAILTAWGNDVSNSFKDGFEQNEKVSFLHYSKEDKSVRTVVLSSALNIITGEDIGNTISYNEDDILFIRTELGIVASVAENIIDDVLISPNPVNTSVQISSAKLISKIEIVDLHGRHILNNDFNQVLNAKVNLDWLSQGIYLVNTTLGTGEVITSKLIKQ